MKVTGKIVIKKDLELVLLEEIKFTVKEKKVNVMVKDFICGLMEK